MQVLLPALNQEERDDALFFVWYDMVMTGIKGYFLTILLRIDVLILNYEIKILIMSN